MTTTTHNLDLSGSRLPRITLQPGIAATVLLLLAGVGLLLYSLWIPAKAQLAQFLLKHSWQRALAGEERPRPWAWADTWPVARLEFAEIGASFIVLEGASGESLAFAPGHVTGTAQPGFGGNSVISAHRDTQFSLLGDLSRGNQVIVERPDGEIVSYRVERQLIVHQSNLSILENDEGGTRLTLVTCYPFDSIMPGTPYRFVLIAKRVGTDRGERETRS